MTLTRIIQRIEDKLADYVASSEKESVFTICGTKCRISYGHGTEVHYGVKSGGFWIPMRDQDAMAAHIHRFQF